MIERLRAGVEDAEPAPPVHRASDVGAVDAAGLAIAATGARVSIYLFDDWPTGAEVPEREADDDDEDVYRVRGTNGRLLLVGEVRLDGPEGRRAKRPVARMATLFAGNERGPR